MKDVLFLMMNYFRFEDVCWWKMMVCWKWRISFWEFEHAWGDACNRSLVLLAFERIHLVVHMLISHRCRRSSFVAYHVFLYHVHHCAHWHRDSFIAL